VFADWSQVSQSGDWSICDRSHFSSSGGGGDAEFSSSVISNFSGYTVCLNFSQFANHANWYDLIQVDKAVKFYWNISDIFVDLEFNDVHDLGGLLDNYWVYFASSDNNSAFGASPWAWWVTQQQRDHWDFTNDCFYVFVTEVNATDVRVSIYKVKGVWGSGGSTQLCSSDYAVASSWWSNVTIDMKIHHDGSGVFFCSYSDSIGTVTSEPSSYDTVSPDNPIWDFASNIEHGLTKVLPKPMSDLISSFASWFGWLMPVLSALWGALLAFLPFAPFLLLFYIVDAGISSVASGSFQPLGVVFSQLYSLGAVVINALTTIGETVWSFIKWW
jgi:hypothetical protein